jgi:hypothetical protein
MYTYTCNKYLSIIVSRIWYSDFRFTMIRDQNVVQLGNNDIAFSHVLGQPQAAIA